MKELKETKDQWLLNIFDALDQMESEKDMKGGHLIAHIMTIATDSLERVKEKILAYEVLTDETKMNIAESYVNMLNESKDLILCRYSGDMGKSRYSLSKSDILTLKKNFFDIIGERFSNDLLVQLFINNYMVCSFSAILDACEQRQLIKMEKDKLKEQ